MAAGLGLTASADDWPQWMGPQRDGVWREDGVIGTIPASGLPVKWRTPVALGYAGPAVAGGRVFVMDYVRQSGETTNNSFNTDELGGAERVLCLDAATGKLLWKHEYARPYNISYSSGPRCTPTVDGDKVYALGAEGNLWCLDAATGRVIWSKDFTKDYGAQTAVWGYASHPLIVGETLYCVVGSKDGVALALDKNTGRERWRALPAEAPGYCPPSLIEHDGKRQVIFWHGEAINSVEPDTGKVNWSVPLKPSYGMAIAAPRKAGPLLFATAFKDVGALLKLAPGASGAEIVWKGNPKNALYSGTASPHIEGDVVYGCDADSGALTCVRLRDGERFWQTVAPTVGEGKKGRYGTAFLIKHGDRFFLFNELGDLILAKLSPKGCEELGRFHVLEPTNKTFGRPMVWSHPAFAQRCLFARNDKELVCVDLAAPVKAGGRKQIVFVHGKASHGYGGHAYGPAFRMLARMLNASVPAVNATVVTDDQDLAPMDRADAIVLGSDGGGLVKKLGDRLEPLMKRGVGLACIHYTVDPTDPKAIKRLIEWIGGSYEKHWSVNPHWEAEFKSFPDHPVARGLKPFKATDEWYYHMRFADGMKGVTPILAAVPPEKTRQGKDGPHSGNPHVRARAGMAEVVGWVYERPGGGRGFGFTGMHSHWNWAQDSFRKSVLNALVWIAGAEVPADGVPSPTPTLEELEGDLGQPRPANFNADAIRKQIEQMNR
jgi:outer membrane protein assembly factor BamB